jgi:hypothetical protein
VASSKDLGPGSPATIKARPWDGMQVGLESRLAGQVDGEEVVEPLH